MTLKDSEFGNGAFSDVIWPFNPPEYKGKRIGDLPSGFVRWIAENAKNDRLATAADKEYQFRERHDTHI